MKPTVGHIGISDNKYNPEYEMVLIVTHELTVTPCSQCPCFSIDSDWGVEDGCGLGCDIEQLAIELSDDGTNVIKTIFGSCKCKLGNITFEGGEFHKPESVTAFRTTYESRLK